MAVLPPLRQVEAVPVTIKGENMICLTDPQGYIEDQLVLSPPAFFIATCLDGTHDVEGIQYEFSQAFGGFEPPKEEIMNIVNSLDESGFLLTEHFMKIRVKVENAFRARHTRRAKLIGQAYPATPKKLRKHFDAFFVDDQGAGCLSRITPGAGRPLRGLIAPHIDFDRGGSVYGAAYRSLYASGKPDLVILFGVAHCGAESPFVLTRKHFETPLGMLPTDQEAITKLEKACAFDPYATEMAHRMEHSLEFQALMLAYLYGNEVPIVPILCAFPGENPDMINGEKDAINKFLKACAGIAGDSKRNVTVIAGADLAHVGRRFGDDVDISEELIDTIRKRDLADLEHAVTGDAENFYTAIMADGNERHVCGLGAIYALLKTLEGTKVSGELLAYNYAPDPVGGIVSFTAIALK